MAAIDHTTIVWKNGEYIPVPFKFDEAGNCIDPLPFEYGRDGNILKVTTPFGEMVYIYDAIKWYRDEYDALYRRTGIKRIYNCWNLGSILNRLKWKLHMMERVCYEYEVGKWKCDNAELYIYHDPMQESYASFYRRGDDTYIVLGGYGHRKNVYCHFMGRGYGEEFEKEMASEAYQWLCGMVIQDMADAMFDNFDDIDAWVEYMEDTFLKVEE